MNFKNIFFIFILVFMSGNALLARPEGPGRLSPPLSHPLGEPVFISGSFGEYRTFSRFHMGLDYKTFLQSGVPVHTPMAGTIRTLHVSELYGYGNALFLQSPNGYLLTFAHLRDFSCPTGTDKLSDIELFRLSLRVLVSDRPLRLRIPPYFHFQKNQCLASTGESGSGPPHLHFEIRKNRIFLDPLSVFGMKIEDFSPPTLLTLYIESRRGVYRFPLEQIMDSKRQSNPASKSPSPQTAPRPSGGKASHARTSYRVLGKLPRFARNEKLRFMLGLYDTMASRNRNGIYGFSLTLGKRKVYEKRLSRLAPRELSLASQVYHTAFTQIGREYVYLFAPAARPYYIANTYAPGKDHLRVTLAAFDASKNLSELTFDLPLAKKAHPIPPSPNNQSRLRSEVPFHTISQKGRLTLQAQSRGSRLSIRYAPGSVQLRGKVRLFLLAKLPEEAQNKLKLPIGPKRSLKTAFEASSPVFYLDGMDLYYRRGAQGRAELPDSGTGKDGLYYYSYAKKLWRLLAHPYKQTNGRNYYRFRVRFTGPIAQLKDLSSPVQTAVFLWRKARVYIKNKKAIYREYSIREYGSGVDLPATSVLLDGRPIPFRWGNDRSVIQVTIPVSLLEKGGSLISLQVADRAGNLSPWYFEWLR